MNCCISYVRISRGSTLAAIWRKTGFPSLAIRSLGIGCTYHPKFYQALRQEGERSKYNTGFFAPARHNSLATGETCKTSTPGEAWNGYVFFLPRAPLASLARHALLTTPSGPFIILHFVTIHFVITPF